MGRHSSPEQWPFYRSVAGWFLPWFMVAAVVGVALWVAVASLGGEDGASPVLSREHSPTPRARSTAPATPSYEPVKPKKDKPPKPRVSPTPEVELITDGITVQVLNASGVSGTEEPIADELTQLGFDIVTVVEASKIYDSTTVFWSTERSRPAAEALAERFGWVAQPKPANLSADVSVHVVVGQDET